MYICSNQWKTKVFSQINSFLLNFKLLHGIRARLLSFEIIHSLPFLFHDLFSSITFFPTHMAKQDLIDFSSLYNLYLKENHSLVLVIPVLSAHNYHSWAKSSKTTLLSKNKFGFIDGSIAKPEKNDKNFDAGTNTISWFFHGLLVLSCQKLPKALFGWTVLRRYRIILKLDSPKVTIYLSQNYLNSFMLPSKVI